MPHNYAIKRIHGKAASSRTRAAFLTAYERNFGNVSITRREVGIHRRTFYRWLDSPTEVNVRFRRALEKLRPKEHHLDMLEAAHTELVRKLDTAAVIFGLKTKAKLRGWGEREFPADLAKPVDENPDLTMLRALVRQRAQSKGITYYDELRIYLGLFGDVIDPTIADTLSAEIQQGASGHTGESNSQ